MAYHHASQAIIPGVYSLTRQAIQLGFLPLAPSAIPCCCAQFRRRLAAGGRRIRTLGPSRKGSAGRSNISTRWVLRQGGTEGSNSSSSTGVRLCKSISWLQAERAIRKASALELSYDRRPWLDGYSSRPAHNFRCSRGRNGIRKARRSTSTAENRSRACGSDRKPTEKAGEEPGSGSREIKSAVIGLFSMRSLRV